MAAFHDMIRTEAQRAAEASPTPFHHLLANLAREGRLLRLYTQNIDCLDTRLPPLATTTPLPQKGPWPSTIQLHGNLQAVDCATCGFAPNIGAEIFVDSSPPECPTCLARDLNRIEAGKRARGVGKLRPRVSLYNETATDEEAIGAVMTADLRKRPDAVIVVGTALRVPGVRKFVKEMCKVVRGRRGGFTAWINPAAAPSEMRDLFNVAFRGRCDEVAVRARSTLSTV